MLGWWRRRREAQIAERAEVLRMLSALGLDEAFDMLVRAKVEAEWRRDDDASAYFTRLRWALFREEAGMRKEADALLQATLARSRPQLVPESADLSADRALVGRVARR